MSLKSALDKHGLWRKCQRPSPRQHFEDLANDIGILNSSFGSRTFWRGLPSRDYLLWPSAFRELEWPDSQDAVDQKVDDHTARIIERFDNATTFWHMSYPPRHVDEDLDKIALMQHQGIGTHLIDLTSDPFIALWFACSVTREKKEGKNDKGGVLLAFNFGNQDESICYDKNTKRTYEWYRPPAVDYRVSSQRSVFLNCRCIVKGDSWASDLGRVDLPELPISWTDNHMTIDLFLDSQSNREQGQPTKMPPVIGFEIRAGSKHKFRQVLDHNFGITKASLYPDIEGIK